MRTLALVLLAGACSSPDGLSSSQQAASLGAGFTAVEPPGGADFIEIWTISERGQIGGVCDGCFGDAGGHGVLRDADGSYHAFDVGVAGATFTSVRGIDARGRRVGFYGLPDGSWHGFIGDSAPFDVPGAVGTMVLGLNERGDVVGNWFDAQGGQHGWVLWRGASQPETLALPFASTAARGINNRRDIVGKTGRHGYRWHAGQVTLIDVPGAVSTIAGAIDDEGAVVGRWVDGAGVQHGFLLRGGEYTVIDIPDAVATDAAGINAAGRIVGTYTDGDGLNHGYLLGG